MAIVLVVDDHPDCAGAVAGLIAAVFGCDALAVHDGPTALRMLRERAFDLMVLDHHMAGMSGLDVLRQLQRSAGHHRHLPVVMYSLDEQSRHEAMELGAVAAETKAMPFDCLAAAMRRHAPAIATAEQASCQQPKAA